MTEQFKASCGHDSVIDIQRAMYGRMHIGRCVSTDYGHLGCEADVRTMTDRRCSEDMSVGLTYQIETLKELNHVQLNS